MPDGDGPRHYPHVPLSLQNLAILFGMAIPLVSVISFVILLRAELDATRADQARTEVQFRAEIADMKAETERAMQEHANIRRDVEALCFARERDDRDSGRQPADIC